MELKDGMTVIAPCDGVYVKKGDKYLVNGVCFINCTSFEIKLKDETRLFCLLEYCAQIELNDWIIKPE
jgi:hypothetical protein